MDPRKSESLLAKDNLTFMAVNVKPGCLIESPGELFKFFILNSHSREILTPWVLGGVLGTGVF